MLERELMPWERVGAKYKKSYKRAGMLVDLDRCIGCHSCSVSCKTENDVPLGNFRMRVRYLEQPDNKHMGMRSDKRCSHTGSRRRPGRGGRSRGASHGRPRPLRCCLSHGRRRGTASSARARHQEGPAPLAPAATAAHNARGTARRQPEDDIAAHHGVGSCPVVGCCCPYSSFAPGAGRHRPQSA